MANPRTPDDTPKTTDGNGEGGIERSFAAAIRAAETAPESEDAWDHLAELADKLQRPDEVAELYRRVLETGLTPSVFGTVAERAVQFHEEWFGDTPDKITSLMSRIIDIDPQAGWAFERLSVMLTSAGQWDELLALYDRTLAKTHDPDRRRQLLNDAAQAAKDFAGEADRAADYMQQQLLLEPDNAQLATSLERILERQKRWQDLIDLWVARLPSLGADEARETQLRIAECWLDELGDPTRALDVLRTLVGEVPGHAEACKHLERILDLDSAELSTRRAALSLLRKNYLVAERPDDVVRVLERALGFAEPDEKRPLHRELATRHAIVGRDEAAIGHYRELLLTDPTDPDARKQLRQLAIRAGRQDLHAEALVAAANACPDGTQQAAVLLEAAHLHRSTLEDPAGAIELYTRVLDAEEAEQSTALTAAHCLEELLAAAERAEERLAVLERLTTLERSSAVRRQVMAEAARLADALGDSDRALSNWKPVLEDDEHDLEALAAVIELLERNERWPELVDALRRRAQANVMPLQRRTDLVRIAQVQTTQLGDPAEAIVTWLSVRAEFGADAQILGALDELMTAAARHQELAEVLGEAAGPERLRSAATLARLGDIHRVELDDPPAAVRWYGDALAVEPDNAVARTGLAALVAEGKRAADAATVLVRAYEHTDDWKLTVDLLEVRLASTNDTKLRANLLRSAAHAHLERGDDPEAALSCLCRALPLEPGNLDTEAQLSALSERVGQWELVAGSLREAAESSAEAPARAAQLRKAEGGIRETRLDDREGALAAYRAAVTAQPDDTEALESIVRCAARTGQWEIACGAAVTATSQRDRIRPELIRALEAGAMEAGAWEPLARAMAVAVSQGPMQPALSQSLEMTIAGWFRDRVGDLEAAEQAAQRAAAQGPTKLDTLELLADVQRREPGPRLIATLLKMDRLQEHSLDSLFEAAKLAVDQQDNPALTQQVLEQLYRKAGSMWVRDDPTTGELQPSEIAQWALDRLIAHHIFVGNASRAVHVLMDGTRLPLDVEKACDLRRRAAEMLAERGERSRAIDVYRGVLDAKPNDREALSRVAAMCEEEGRVSEALVLRLRELALIEDLDTRLQLRLDHSRLTGALEEQGGRVASLRENLEDVPGHEPSIDELVRVLDERGKQGELADILSEQAAKLEDLGDRPRAARLWTRVASLAETPLGDLVRAISAHTRAVVLEPSNDALDALARLHLQREEPAEAARWLERRLDTTAATERVAVLLKLARARIRADQIEAAIGALKTAFDEAPRNAEVRKLLLKLYRSRKELEPLAQTLTRGALAISDTSTVLAYAREAADIYHHKLAAPQESVPVLQKAVELAADDRELRSMLAEGLRAAGELDAARSLLERLIGDFGRRRSPERAQVHLQLAQVAHAQGQTDVAIDQLDTASKMDAGNATILKVLGELAREAGELDRAERAYRTLLVTVRRAGDKDALPIGPSEVLFELSRIAADRDQTDQATELVESVLESLSQHDAEAPRIQAKLEQRGEPELLCRVLEHRLTYVKTPHRRAEVYAALAQTLSGLERSDDALEAMLQAVNTDPSSPIHHQAAWELAASQGKLDAYVSVVEALLSDERADTSPHVRCELLLRLGAVLEKERNDLDRAHALYAQAEATGVRTVDVWRAQARVAGARGDQPEQIRLLEQLASLGEDQAETRADALYRMAEVQLASEETFEEGLATLGKALEDSFKAERAALILRRASEHHSDHLGLLDAYEQVARRAEDQRILLHYLDRRASHMSATPEQAREAVELALALEEPEHAEELMLRAAEIGHAMSRSDDLKRVDWALLGLAERRMLAGDLAGAVKWLADATEVADLEAVLELAERVAELADRPDGDLTLAAKLYEKLLERAPDARRAWEPLANLYAKLDDVERLEHMVEETLDGLQEPADRNALRVALARALLRNEARAAGAVTVLQEVLLEDPENEQAQRLLFSHLERTGQTEELVALLELQLEAARDRQDVTGIKAASLRLAERQSEHGKAADILRSALRWAPEDLELLQGLLAQLDDDDKHERADLMEALVKVTEARKAGKLALALVALREELEDEDGALRALRLGAEHAPEDATIREMLEQRYRERGDFAGLVESLLGAAERREDPEGRSSLFREAARLRRDELGDPHGAADLLRQACSQAPEDTALRVELATTLSAAGQHEQADATVSEALEQAEDPAARLAMLQARAQLRGAAGNETGALADLEDAFGIDPAGVAADFEAAIRRAIDTAASRGDADAERTYTLRCVDIILTHGEREAAVTMLASWTNRHPDDLEALRGLRELDTADGRWEAVAQTCERLVELEEGGAQIDAAMGLSHAYQELGEPERARAGLEHVRNLQPESPQVRAELRKIYEQLDDQQFYARLLLDDAGAETDPETKADLLRRAGAIFASEGDSAAAIPPLREAFAIDPTAPAAIVPLADAYLLAGWFEEALTLLDEAIGAGKGRRTPEMCVYYHRKAQVAEATGDRDDQLALLLEAHNCNKKNGLVAADLANVAEELGDLDLAAKTLRTITLIDTDCPITRGEAFLRQGRIAHRQGDDKSAKMWARRAKREEPDSADIDQFLADLGER